MREKFISRFVENLLFRLSVTVLTLTLLVGLITTWEAAAYLSLLDEINIVKTFLGLLIFGVTGTAGTAILIIYPIERWLIRDRASNSWSWVIFRLVLYLCASVPTGLGTLVSMRLTMPKFPDIVESIYFVQAVAGAFALGIIYTLIEHVIKEMRKRENKFKMEIKELRIEIDQLKKEKQVEEITNSEFFQDLKQKATNMRKDE